MLQTIADPFLLRITCAIGICIRYIFHWDGYAAHHLGIIILSALIPVSACYITLSSLLIRAGRDASRKTRLHLRRYPSLLIFNDCWFFLLAWTFTFKLESDVHLAFFVPLFTLISEIQVVRSRSMVSFVAIFFIIPVCTILLPSIYLWDKMPALKSLSFSLRIQHRSTLSSLVDIVFPRTILWLLVGNALLSQQRTLKHRAAAALRLKQIIDSGITQKTASQAWEAITDTFDSKEAFEAVMRFQDYQRAALEEALAAAANRAQFFETLASELPYPVFVKDAQRRFVWVDKRLAEEMPRRNDGTSWNPDYMIGLSDREIFGDGPRVDAYEASDIAVLHGSNNRIEVFEPHYNTAVPETTSIYTIKLRIRDQNGLVIGLMGICRDATQQDDFDLYREAIQGSQHCIFRKNAGHQYISVNREFAASVGIEIRDILGRTDELLFGEKGKEYMKQDEKLLKGQQSIYKNRERRIMLQYGPDLRWIEVRKMPLRDTTGRIYGIQGVLWDIQEGADENERFINVFLHDAPTPVKLIEENYTESLLSEVSNILAERSFSVDTPIETCLKLYQVAEQAKERLTLIRSAAQFIQAQYTCFGMLRTSWLERDYFEEDQDFDIQETIEGIAQHLRINAGRYAIQTDYSNLSSVLFHGKSSAIKNAFWILVDNAVKASFRMQQTREEEMLDAEINYSQHLNPKIVGGNPPKAVFSFSDNILRMEVTDAGDGLSSENVTRLNELNPRQTRTSRFGWVIVTYLSQQLKWKRIISSHGLGKGTTVILNIPILQKLNKQKPL